MCIAFSSSSSLKEDANDDDAVRRCVLVSIVSCYALLLIGDIQPGTRVSKRKQLAFNDLAEVHRGFAPTPKPLDASPNDVFDFEHFQTGNFPNLSKSI